jgi:hypothetical protein
VNFPPDISPETTATSFLYITTDLFFITLISPFMAFQGYLKKMKFLEVPLSNIGKNLPDIQGCIKKAPLN